MAIRQTYQGVVKEGRVQLSTAASLPEGSQVYVLVADEWQERPLLDPHLARCKANGWLVSHVGSVLVQQPQLLQECPLKRFLTPQTSFRMTGVTDFGLQLTGYR